MKPNSKPKSLQVEFLERHLQRPLFNIDDYGFLYEVPAFPSRFRNDNERLMAEEYRKCYRLNAEGEVIALNLWRCQITDLFFLRELSVLQSLNLGDNEIADSSFLRALPSLQSLYIWKNPITDYSGLHDLSDLQSLNVGGNKIADASFLHDLPSLQALSIWENPISDYSFLNDFSSLHSLNLFSNEVSDYSFLRDLPALRSLHLGNYEISDTSHLSDLSALQSLHIWKNQISDFSFLRDLSALQSLDLSQNKISDTSFLRDLSALQSLDLSINQISDTSFLRELSALQSLNLSFNQVSDTSFLRDLTELQSLDLSINQISDTSFLRDLSSLRYLNLGKNQISDTSFLRELTSIQSLHLSLNDISDPSFLRGLTALQSLNLGKNQITDTHFLCELSDLQFLILSENRISDASFLIDLPKLRTADLRKNQLQHLPESLLGIGIEIEEGEDRAGFPGSLSWHGNPIETPSVEILRQGHQAIVDFYGAGAKEPLREAKVLVVGEAEVGKTSLIKQLLGEAFDKSERKTHDIARHQLPLTCGEKGEIDLRVWDFGGQDIMHATHQFFLTRRSVYLLVLNSRQNESQSRIDYWLRLIESFGADSPVIVVCNKCDEEVMDLPWKAYREKFPQIKHYVKEVSCYHDPEKGIDKRKGIGEVRDRIAQVVEEDLPHVGEPVPVTWFNVKRDLEEQTAEGTDYLLRSAFNCLCEDKKVKPGAEGTLLQFLHDLGVVLHFDEGHPLMTPGDARFEETKVLNPAWVTAAIYKVLNDGAVIQNRGVLTQAALERILREVDDHDYDKQQQGFILGMMDQFDLCFEMPDRKGAWLIPDLLPKDQPDTGEWNGALRFRYNYSVLPGSVISRFIVRMEPFISAKTYWRYGVVLIREGIRALVRADLNDGILDVALLETRAGQAKQRREFLAAIRAQFEMIHGAFSEKFEVKEFAENTEHAGHFEPYEKLLKMERAGQEEVWVDGLDEMRPVAEFLDGVALDRGNHFRLDRLDTRGEPMRPLLRGVVDEGAEEPDPEVFISYAWRGESEAMTDKIVEQLRERLEEKEIALIRDTDEMTYRQSIRDFMKRLGQGHSVIVVLSKRYLESPNCMFELTEIARAQDGLQRVFPVVLPDAGIFDAKTRLGYIKHWEDEKKELEAAMHEVGPENLQGIREEIDLYVAIRAKIAGIVDLLGNMNVMTSNAHEEEGFETLFDAIVATVLGESG